MAIKPTADFGNFDALDIRAGRIVRVEDAQTRKPTYKLTIDFGPEIGTKVSCGAYRNYAKNALLGKMVICVLNFGVKKMGPDFRSAGTRRRQRGRRDDLSHGRAERPARRRSVLTAHQIPRHRPRRRAIQ